MNVVALECANFQLAKLAADRELVGDAQRAAVEAVAIAARYLGTVEPAVARLAVPAVVCPLLRLAPRLVPFDVEGYLRQHYTKVGDQTLAGLDATRAKARELDLPHAALDRLRVRLDETRSRCRS
jgi:2-dehydropantoate 2-reductase